MRALSDEEKQMIEEGAKKYVQQHVDAAREEELRAIRADSEEYDTLLNDK